MNDHSDISRGSAQGKRVIEKSTHDTSGNRFQIELEFVQCLANPNYLNFLAQRKYLQMPQFVAYLKYLQYWRQPEYAKYLRYPMCLYFLDLLQHEHFRKEISSSHAAKYIEDQQLLHWQHYARKRSRMLNDAAASRQQQQQQQRQGS
jgi:mediator of RNA polymerase II transcription subunit 31